MRGELLRQAEEAEQLGQACDDFVGLNALLRFRKPQGYC